MCLPACQTHSPHRPAPSLQVCLCFLFALFSLCSYFSPSVFVSKMNFCTRGSVIWHCAIELASVKCTKLHSSNKTESILASLPGAFTLNGVVDCFNPACFHCVKDNKLVSYSEITLVLRKCNVVQFFCRRAKALSNIDASSSYSPWACTAVGHVFVTVNIVL